MDGWKWTDENGRMEIPSHHWLWLWLWLFLTVSGDVFYQSTMRILFGYYSDTLWTLDCVYNLTCFLLDERERERKTTKETQCHKSRSEKGPPLLCFLVLDGFTLILISFDFIFGRCVSKAKGSQSVLSVSLSFGYSLQSSWRGCWSTTFRLAIDNVRYGTVRYGTSSQTRRKQRE